MGIIVGLHMRIPNCGPYWVTIGFALDMGELQASDDAAGFSGPICSVM